MGKKKLTPEEKKALKLQKKLDALEKQKQQKRDQLGREIKYGALTIKRHEKNWRQMLMKITLDRMRQDLEFAWQNFERVIDSKDFVISVQMDDLVESENQYMRNVKSHFEHIDELIRIFETRVDELKEDFENEIDKLKIENEEEINAIKQTANEGEEYIRTMLFGLELAKKELEAVVKVEYYSKLDEEKTKSNDVIEKLRSNLGNMRQKLVESTSQFLQNYHEMAKQRKKEHDLLKEQEDAIQILIAKQLIQIAKSYEYVKKLRDQLSEYQTDGAKIVGDLETERNFFLDVFNKMKIKMKENLKHDFGQLSELCQNCEAALAYLKDLSERGERILRVSAVCMNLETQKEKILTFPDPYDKADLNELKDAEPLEGNLKNLELFWQKVGQVDATLYALHKEKKFLQCDNYVLRKRLAEYCTNLMWPKHEPKKKKQFDTVGNVDANMFMAKYKNFKD